MNSAISSTGAEWPKARDRFIKTIWGIFQGVFPGTTGGPERWVQGRLPGELCEPTHRASSIPSSPEILLEGYDKEIILQIALLALGKGIRLDLENEAML